MSRKFHKTRLALAVGAVSALIAPYGITATVEELSAQLQAMQAQMQVMQKEMQVLREQKGGTWVVEERDYGELQEEVAVLREDADDLDDRLMQPERHAALDAIEWGGDFRFQAHSIDAKIPDYIDGMRMQQIIVQNLGLQPGFTFDELKSTIQSFPPETVDGLLEAFSPQAFQEGYDYDDDIIRTSRLRLDMRAAVANNVSFTGRLSMYKVWGDSTGIQVFNGQPTSINWDGTQSTYPNSDDNIHVERAYFTWSKIGGTDGFLSIGRRPSTNGVPLNFREDEPRGGTPMGSLFNYQFDGITVGYHINDFSTVRICYGVGFESGWGNGSQLSASSQLDDTDFVGVVWDVWDTPSMYIHLIAAHARDITDGFPGMTILPNDPLTGEPTDLQVPIRYEPSGTIGDMDLAGFVITRHDGPFDYFVSYGYSESNPTNFTSPFGGLFADPFENPESQDGDMWYLGGRYSLPDNKTKVGVEFNHGSKYWFNFALSEDDFLAPKTSTRGDVWEAYITHRIRESFIAKLAFIDYSYDYSGSGWLLGAPKNLDNTPILGFPTYDEAQMWTLGLTARF